MRKSIFITIFCCSAACFSQIKIGGENVTNSAVSLEFGTGYKGVVLPWVTNVTSVNDAVGGTVVFDSSEGKIKYYNGSSWVDLSKVANGNLDTTLQQGLTELPEAKVTVGVPTNTSGILVLEDKNKAMVLPKVESPHINIISPSAGMMVYDTLTKQLAVYNGAVWTFWKPKSQ